MANHLAADYSALSPPDDGKTLNKIVIKEICFPDRAPPLKHHKWEGRQGLPPDKFCFHRHGSYVQIIHQLHSRHFMAMVA